MIFVVHQFPADSPCEMKILGHDCDSPGVERTEIDVLEETYKVGLGRLLEGEEG